MSAGLATIVMSLTSTSGSVLCPCPAVAGVLRHIADIGTAQNDSQGDRRTIGQRVDPGPTHRNHHNAALIAVLAGIARAVEGLGGYHHRHAHRGTAIDGDLGGHNRGGAEARVVGAGVGVDQQRPSLAKPTSLSEPSAAVVTTSTDCVEADREGLRRKRQQRLGAVIQQHLVRGVASREPGV